jgi:hypothetical protein
MLKKKLKKQEKKKKGKHTQCHYFNSQRDEGHHSANHTRDHCTTHLNRHSKGKGDVNSPVIGIASITSVKNVTVQHKRSQNTSRWTFFPP